MSVEEPAILLVDDEPDINYMLERMLKTKGYQVHTYNDPQKALAEFKAGIYALAILDFKMRPINGFELYQQILKIDDNLKVLFLSADSEHYAEEKKNLPVSGARFYMHKPIRMQQLLKQVQDMLGKR